jgi:hypothetical protein
VLFGVVMKGHPGTLNERSARRMQMQQPPEGVNVVGEYWFPTDDPSVMEAEDPGTVKAIRLAWDDIFDVAVFPIVTAEEGLEQLRQMMPAQGG